MTQEITENVRRLESLLDLETLQYGDIVQIKINFYPYHINKSTESLGMYFSKLTQKGARLNFITPMFDGKKEYILDYKTTKNQVQVQEGKIVLFERCCNIRQYDLGHPQYKYYNNVLIRAGLRRA